MPPKYILDELEKTYEGKSYARYRNCNGQKTAKLETEVKRLISEKNLTATVAKGFLEYMKLVIDGCSYLPQEE